jgi:hypothetical protein
MGFLGDERVRFIAIPYSIATVLLSTLAYTCTMHAQTDFLLK